MTEKKTAMQTEMPNVDILCRSKQFSDSAHKYLWSDRDSYERNIYSRAMSLDEIARRVKRMFPNNTCRLVLL